MERSATKRSVEVGDVFAALAMLGPPMAPKYFLSNGLRDGVWMPSGYWRL